MFRAQILSGESPLDWSYEFEIYNLSQGVYNLVADDQYHASLTDTIQVNDPLSL